METTRMTDDEKTPSADDQPDPGTPADGDERTPFILLRLAQEVEAAEAARTAVLRAMRDADTAIARHAVDTPGAAEDAIRALAEVRVGVREAGAAAGRAAGLAAELLAPETLAKYAPAGALLATQAAEQAHGAVTALYRALAWRFEDGEDGEDDGDDRIPLKDTPAETMN